jgi:hypothetical protein
MHTFTLEAGRHILKDGKPFIAIQRTKSKEHFNGYDYPPTEADTLAREMAEWLNARESQTPYTIYQDQEEVSIDLADGTSLTISHDCCGCCSSGYNVKVEKET